MVVHGFVAAGGRLALWAEGEASPARPPRHPFAEPLAIAGESLAATLVLPTAEGAPLASPEAGGAVDADAPRKPWTVPAVVLRPGEDPEVLIESVGRPGASLGFLADLVGFAADLAARGRFLPAVVVGATTHTASWRAALFGVDRLRFDDLCRAMPGVALAGGVWEGPADAVAAALDHQLDGLVRSRLSAPLLPTRPSAATPTHAFVEALGRPGGSFVGNTAEVRSLQRRLDVWQASGAPGAVRTCFRLSYVEEGEEDEPAGWLLEFLLQPVADPSVLVPATHIWRDVASPLVSWIDDPQETLLAGLGRASRLYPDLTEALYDRRPAQAFLDTAGAYRFLTHAPLLTEAGFGVLVPKQWQRRVPVGLSLTIHSRQTTTAVLRDRTANLSAIVDYKWGLALGDEFLSESDLVELARAKLPLVRLRGRWVYLDREQLTKGLAYLARGGEGQLSAGEALRMVRLLPDRERPLPVTAVDGSGWLADLLAGRVVDQLELLEAPETLKASLRPYQLRGFSWLAFLDRVGVGALLADDMGLGKTVQLLALEAWCRQDGPRPPTLIVCPLSVLGNWQREIERFAPTLTTHVHHGADRSIDTEADLVLTTYSLASRDLELLAETQWDRIVLDEAQHVKNSATDTAQALRQLRARHRVALTGTPVENRLADLWSIMDFLNPGLLGPASTFRSRYSVPIERYSDPAAVARLRQVTGPLLLRRLKSDRAVIADLPEKLERTQWCNLTVEQATLYRAVVDEIFVKLRESRYGTRRKGLVLAAMTKLKQACNHPAHLLGDGSAIPGRSGKVDRLEEILANALAGEDRALVFTQFTTFGSMLVPHLRRRLGAEVSFLHGGVPKGARDRMVEEFQSGAGPAVMLLSLKAGGTGLNLTAANHVIHLDRWWNPATETQATDRAFRIGQTRDVQVHTFVCIGTIEERIDRMIAEKRTLADTAIGNDESWLGDLSTDDLLELVSLSPEAIGD